MIEIDKKSSTCIYIRSDSEKCFIAKFDSKEILFIRSMDINDHTTYKLDQMAKIDKNSNISYTKTTPIFKGAQNFKFFYTDYSTGLESKKDVIICKDGVIQFSDKRVRFNSTRLRAVAEFVDFWDKNI
jgi:hypothetical protein